MTEPAAPASPARPRVAFLCDQTVDHHFPPHFGDVYTRRLRAAGWATSLLAFVADPTSAPARRLVQEGDVHLLRRRSRSLAGRLGLALAMPWRVGKYLRRDSLGAADVFVVHNDPILGWLAWAWARRHRKAFVYRISHLVPETLATRPGRASRILAAAARRARNALLRRSDAIVPMSAEMARTLADETGLSADSMAPVVSMVSMDPPTSAVDCRPEAARVQDALAQVGCRFWLVYLGTLNRVRGLTFLVDTLLATRAQGLDAGLLILGVARDHEDRQFIADHAAERGASDYIAWCDPVPEPCLKEVLAPTHLGLSPFPPDRVVRNNSPVKTLEYIRAGLLVVASPIPDNDAVLAASGAGQVAEHDPEAFARTIAALLSESEATRQERSRGAQEWLAANRDLNAATRQWQAILSGVLPATLRQS